MPDVESWADEFSRINNDDPELNAHGKYFSCSYMLDMEDRRVIVDMHKGRVENINLDPEPLDAYQFALRAPAETWRGMGESMPKPMFHGIWAASFREGMTMEGDLLVLMQNLRCFTRQIEILRETGVPV
ncbi:MAG TPA: hypothetical protein VM299_06325 [Solirubrobacteraceae bacterium]|jgi:hypothetical protein|nr:hypothetical protein [Solirubrobacteraceae bacterium]